MKHKTLITKILKLSIGSAAAIGLMAGSLSAAPKGDAQTADKGELLVVVDDLQGRLDFSTDRVREDLLRTAFYNVAERNEWLGEYAFEYNHALPEEGTPYLKFDIIDWERTRTGYFECTMSARYTNPDGETMNLGVFHGMISGITVTTGFDIGEHFVDAAEDAFSDALKRLHRQQMGDAEAS